jgi:hypothetical protein
LEVVDVAARVVVPPTDDAWFVFEEPPVAKTAIPVTIAKNVIAAVTTFHGAIGPRAGVGSCMGAVGGDVTDKR